MNGGRPEDEFDIPKYQNMWRLDILDYILANSILRNHTAGQSANDYL